MNKYTLENDPQQELRNLVGRLSVDLLRQRPSAHPGLGGAIAASYEHPRNMPSKPRQDESPGFMSPYVRAHSKAGTAALEREAVRTRSLGVRDMLALVATRGKYRYFEIASLLEGARPQAPNPEAIRLAEGANTAGLLALARAAPAQRLVASDEFIALSLYESVRACHGTYVFSTVDWINYIGLLISRGHLERAGRLLEVSPLAGSDPYEYGCLRANCIAAHKAGGIDHATWMGSVNAMFQLDGIESLSIQSGHGPLIDRISCVAEPCTDRGPLVSVLMTHYCVGGALRTAVDSVLGQSWGNVELILVDDCSPRDEFQALRELESEDPRIRVLRTERNSGTYTARNIALAHAKGEFVTCHDSDDWSHPRKIELQVRDLIQNDTIGNLSRLARTSEDLRFERFSATGKYVYPNTSSLMFRREPVVSRLGVWDPVRTGADTEFYKRIELVFDTKLRVLPGAPLSFARTRSDALTSGTLRMGWSSPARRYYRAAWAQWHRDLKCGKSSPMLTVDGARKFPCPETNLPSSGNSHPGVYDVVVVADMRCKSLAPYIANEVEALTAAALEVAICHVPALRRATAGRELLDPAIQALLNGGACRRIELDDTGECGLLLVRDPSALQFSAGLESGIRAQRILTATNLAPFENGSREAGYTVSVVDAATVRMFRGPNKWATGSAKVQAHLESMLPQRSLHAVPWHQAFRLSVTQARSHAPRQRPVIGFSFPDGKGSWKAWGLLDQRLFPVKGPRVRVIGGRHTPAASSDEWEVLPHGSETDEEFFSRIDFMPYFPPHDSDEGVSPKLAAALAYGCIVLAPPRFAPILGDAALYVDPADASSLVSSFFADSRLMNAQSVRARQFAESQLTPAAYACRVKNLLSGDSWLLDNAS